MDGEGAEAATSNFKFDRSIANSVFALLLCLVATRGEALAPATLTAAIDKIHSVDEQCFIKGGIGIVHVNLHIDVNAADNRLILKDRKTWSGKAPNIPEVVFVTDDKVWPAQSLPADFDLNRSIGISFEPGKVKFFDFAKASGCSYVRRR